jgi:hypothetical protein
LTVDGEAERVVVVGPTLKDIVPSDGENSESPEYDPVTVSLPGGAAVDVQDPAPAERLAEHIVVDPTVNVTLPVGIPDPVADVTMAEYVTS